MTETQAKLNNLHDEFYSRTYDIDIEALSKKLQAMERDIRDKVDCDIFDKEIHTCKTLVMA
jgi:hypothetical protein